MSGQRFWVGVAAANHVARGKTGSFMQVNHGKEAPLRRLSPGDVITYYSPVLEFGSKESLKAFTALGTIKSGEPYQGDMGDGFHPYRRDVQWLDVKQAPILPLLEQLSFTKGEKYWGYRFHFGLFEISVQDASMIASAMGHAGLVKPGV